ncbi:MAG: hypothetical protein HC913_05705 [Microscillaceae bacterium]|nr:hypothetical protein [Microscillaceae bacterium]
MDLYKEPKTEVQKEYIQFSQKYFNTPVPQMDTIVINNFFRDWGHQFIHDEKSLRFLLEQAGFQKIDRRHVNESPFPELARLEQHYKEIGEEFNILESIVVEAQK